MNTGFAFHISEDALEEYALGRLPSAHCEPLDEHLLVCPACQNALEVIDDYVNVIRAALAAFPRSRKERGRSKAFLNLRNCEVSRLH
jgi:anti-sigma factor RsiW